MKPARRLSDGALATAIGAALFVLGAWPLLLTTEQPYQDLPNHLATAEILQHIDRYPEIAFNGFLKTNAALVAWLTFVGRAVGISLAGKIFTVITLAATAFMLPRFVLSFAGRARMEVSAFFAWPLVHHWFVAMGMLNFALAIPLGMGLLLAMRRQSLEPTLPRGVGVAALAIALWYAHVFMLAMVGLLVVVHVLTRESWSARAKQGLALLAPLVPAGLLVVSSVAERFSTRAVIVPRNLPVSFHGPIDLLYNVWSEYAAAFTPRSASSVVVTIALAWFAWKRRAETPPFFGPAGLAVLCAGFALLPYNAFNWAYLSSRFLPLLYLGGLLRVPDSLAPRWRAFFATCAAAYSVGLGVDYVRLDRDRAQFTAGISAVPEGSKLLPVIFAGRVSSDNTWSLLHAWGYYVLAKRTSAPLVFAESRSYPITWKEPPPPPVARATDAPVVQSLSSEAVFCKSSEVVWLDADCHAVWRAEWAKFWRDTAVSFDHVLVWRAPDAVLATLPPHLFATKYDVDGLLILERE